MLKSLDHAVFNPVPNWEDLAEQFPVKRLAEFGTRTAAAILFVVVEFRMERFADAQTSSNALFLARSDEIQHNSLSQAGQWGLWLYIALIIWWVVGFWIARHQMPKLQLGFYFAGVANSLFIAKYAATVNDSDGALTLLMLILFILVGAIYMLVYVLLDVPRMLGIIWQPLVARLHPSPRHA